jgi:hypothetical protein
LDADLQIDARGRCVNADVAIVVGAIGRANVGGKAWVYLNYLLGLRDLGFDVVYLEDAGHESWVYDWPSGEFVTDVDYPARFVEASLRGAGFDGRWAYRAGDETRGATLDEIREWCRSARLLIVHGDPIPVWRPEYDTVRRRAYVDLDPGFTQWRLAKRDGTLVPTVDKCHVVFTIGQHVGASNCPIPTVDREWIHTLPPVHTAYWSERPSPADAPFTAVMDWRGFRDIEFEGAVYGQKDREFPQFRSLPSLTNQPLLLAISGKSPDELTSGGWGATEGWKASRTAEDYESFIRSSRAEFGIAKHGYVKSRGGWFSDRTVCYLASGRPVLLQDTGLSGCLPIGAGILTFSDLATAVQGIEAINGNYDMHARAARKVAEDVFDARLVLTRFLQDAA